MSIKLQSQRLILLMELLIPQLTPTEASAANVLSISTGFLSQQINLERFRYRERSKGRPCDLKGSLSGRALKVHVGSSNIRQKKNTIDNLTTWKCSASPPLPARSEPGDIGWTQPGCFMFHLSEMLPKVLPNPTTSSPYQHIFFLLLGIAGRVWAWPYQACAEFSLQYLTTH
jgi:hypothetical protein